MVVALGALATMMLAACAADRPYVWVDQLQDRPLADAAEYRIAVGDVLGVRVWNQESMSTARARVRDDGKISIPFLQDVEVVGLTPGELGSRLQVKLKAYVVSPVVTVTLEERAPIRVSVLGEVRTPGAYEVQPGAGVLSALAAAGGLTEYARRDGIYVLRTTSASDAGASPGRIRFRWDDLSSGTRPAATFRVRPGDVVVVE
jgi:polysaccharide export outer membrane protein